MHFPRTLAIAVAICSTLPLSGQVDPLRAEAYFKEAQAFCDRDGGRLEKRDAEQKAKVAELRKRFVDRPVLVLPNAGGSFSSSGITPIPGVGTVFPEVHVTAEWGVLQAAQVLRPDDRSNITVPAPASVQGSTLEGDGWTLKMAPGWVVRAGNRPGDFQLVRNVPRQ